jgi:hypothetical protein
MPQSCRRQRIREFGSERTEITAAPVWTLFGTKRHIVAIDTGRCIAVPDCTPRSGQYCFAEVTSCGPVTP